jgi:hypothetical protein
MSVPGKLEMITSNVSTVMKNIQLTTEGVWCTSKSNKKIHPRLRERNTAKRPIQSGVTYAQVVQGQTEIPQTNATQLNPTNMTQPANDLTELKQMMNNLTDQIGTLINLISALVNKNN